MWPLYGLLVLTALFPLHSTHAGCLNCANTPSTDGTVVDEPGDTTDDSQGDDDDKKRAVSDAGIPIPILFGVARNDITPNFGDARGGGTRIHEGLDMLAPKGTPIVSPTSARVEDVGAWEYAGKYVVTKSSTGERYSYMHLDEIADIEEGDRLSTGDLIGYVGDTGNAAGGPAHLHLELRNNRTLLDPFDHITKEFPIKQKMLFLENILDDHNEPRKLATFLARTFESSFIHAHKQGVDIPSEILRANANIEKATENSTILAHDLTFGATGADVSILQSTLILEGFLDIPEPTGYYGPLTTAAVKAYQTHYGVLPTTGTVGAHTRSHLRGIARDPVIPSTQTITDPDLIALVKLLIALDIISDDKRDLARALISAA